MIKPPFSYSHIASYVSCATRHNYERILKIKPLEDSTHPAAHRGTMLHEMCEEFINGNIKDLPRDLMQFKTVLEKLREQGAKSEVKLACTKDFEPCAYDSPDAYFYGVIDTLELRPTVAQVGDWKSGKKRDYSQQLKFYTLLVLINYPEIQKSMTRIRYLDLGISEPGVEYNRKDLTTIIQEFQQIVDRMLKDRIRSPTPGDKCKFCPYSKRQMNLCKW